MKLTYRGIEYEYTPVAVEVRQTEVCGKYRGAEWKCDRSQNTAVAQQNAVELKYRGVPYYSGNPEQIEILLHHQPLFSSQKSKVKSQKLNNIFGKSNQLLVSDRRNNSDLAKTHQENLRRDLQRRLEIAKQKGDQNLIRILEDEANQL